MREQVVLTRRRLAAALPIVALAGAAVTAAAPLPAPVADDTSSWLDVADTRCRQAAQALTDALYAYECALPAPHFTIDMTKIRYEFGWERFGSTPERRLFDGKAPKRSINPYGIPAERYVATEETIEQDLYRCPAEDRDRRGLLYRMRRRAKARTAKMEALEASFRLEELQREVDAAERMLEELTQELFAAPATSMAAVMVQAKALSVYAETIDAGHAKHQAGRYGAQLAAGLQNVVRAA